MGGARCLTNAFSKKLDSHIHALALYFVFYNFTRIHKTLRMSPAMAAGITDCLWSLEDVVAKVDELVPAPKARGPYKKQGGCMNTKAALILGSAIIVAVALYVYFSPFQTCVREKTDQFSTWMKEPGDDPAGFAKTQCAENSN